MSRSLRVVRMALITAMTQAISPDAAASTRAVSARG